MPSKGDAPSSSASNPAPLASTGEARPKWRRAAEVTLATYREVVAEAK